ncbi:THIO, partial [Symbiodinium sp. KB8]
MPVEVKTAGEFSSQLAAAGGKLVVVDFYATWCGPCKAIAPFVEQLSGQHPDVVFLKVCEGGEADELFASQGVRAMPTFKFYLKKACVDTLQGADPQALQAKVVQHKANAFSAFGGTGATLASSSAPPASPADARAARLAALAGGSGQGEATTSAAAPAAAGGSSQGGGAEPPSEADVDADALEQLISMGFPRNRSVRALYSVASTGAPPSDLLTFAIEWLSAHAEDPGLDDPVLVSKRQRV